jgi:hypothetical protein
MLARRGLLAALAAPGLVSAANLMPYRADLRLGRWVVLDRQPWETDLPDGQRGRLLYYRPPTDRHIGLPLYGVRPGTFIDMREVRRHRCGISVADVNLPLHLCDWPVWSAAGATCAPA